MAPSLLSSMVFPEVVRVLFDFHGAKCRLGVSERPLKYKWVRIAGNERRCWLLGTYMTEFCLQPQLFVLFLFLLYNLLFILLAF